MTIFVEQRDAARDNTVHPPTVCHSMRSRVLPVFFHSRKHLWNGTDMTRCLYSTLRRLVHIYRANVSIETAAALFTACVLSTLEIPVPSTFVLVGTR